MPNESGMLAPLQVIMLLDSLAGQNPGSHVQQLEVILEPERSAREVEAAWAKGVETTEVLRMAFELAEGGPFKWTLAKAPGRLEVDHDRQESFENWLAEDRIQPLLISHAAPWRVRYWPRDRRLVWTFHHALLDGRSITEILKRFLKCLETGNPPQSCPVTEWTPADAEMKERAALYFKNAWGGCEAASGKGTPLETLPRKSVRCLGPAAALRLERLSMALEITAATILCWTWGQAVAVKSGGKAAIVEQVRCGPPQPGRLGFTMNTLPVRIERARGRPVRIQLREFRKRLLALRAIEAFPPQDLPPEVNEMTQSPWSSVVMCERSSPAWQAGLTRSEVILHECEGDSLTAAVYQMPDLRMEVEGAGNRDLLELWAGLLTRLMEDPSLDGKAFLAFGQAAERPSP